jgi:Carboxylesterase family
MPPLTPSRWRGPKMADVAPPACPQAAPEVTISSPEALLHLPRGRVTLMRKLLPMLANFSEDCLYLNLYIPRPGESLFGVETAAAAAAVCSSAQTDLCLGSKSPFLISQQGRTAIKLSPRSNFFSLLPRAAENGAVIFLPFATVAFPHPLRLNRIYDLQGDSFLTMPFRFRLYSARLDCRLCF